MFSNLNTPRMLLKLAHGSWSYQYSMKSRLLHLSGTMFESKTEWASRLGKTRINPRVTFPIDLGMHGQKRGQNQRCWLDCSWPWSSSWCWTTYGLASKAAFIPKAQFYVMLLYFVSLPFSLGNHPCVATLQFGAIQKAQIHFEFHTKGNQCHTTTCVLSAFSVAKITKPRVMFPSVARD